MPVTGESLAHDALGLSADQRKTFACRLLLSVEPAPEPGVGAAWDARFFAASHDLTRTRH